MTNAEWFNHHKKRRTMKYFITLCVMADMLKGKRFGFFKGDYLAKAIEHVRGTMSPPMPMPKMKRKMVKYCPCPHFTYHGFCCHTFNA